MGYRSNDREARAGNAFVVLLLLLMLSVRRGRVTVYCSRIVRLSLNYVLSIVRFMSKSLNKLRLLADR